MSICNRLRSLYLAITTLTCMCLASSSFADAPPVRVMSFNLRFGNANDGPNSWEHRKDYVLETVDAFTPDLLGTQETLTYQRDHIAKRFTHLKPFGVGREDGAEKGEMAALFYNENRFEKLDGGNFWLSETPEVPGSKGWDTSLPRVASWVKLSDKKDENAKPILFINTHFDHMGKEARYQSAKLIRKKLSELGDGHRLIVTGDFNAGVDSKPYTAMFKPEGADEAALTLLDTHLASQSPHPDKNEGTFTGFDPNRVSGARIDWIAVSDDWTVRSARIDRSIFNGRLPSDHYPITAVLTVAANQSPLKVLSYNIHHARGLDDKLGVKRIAQVIRDADADFVALQEVDQNTKRSENVDQAAQIAKLTDMYHHFGKAIDLQGGAYGQALLSKYPLEDFQTIQLPNESGREQRIALTANAQVGEHTIQLIGTHLDHQAEELRIKQVEAIVPLLKKDADISILAGDMNALPESRTLEVLLKVWGKPSNESVSTYSAKKATRQIDFVLLNSPSGKLQDLTTGSLVAPATEASDHLPLLFAAHKK